MILSGFDDVWSFFHWLYKLLRVSFRIISFVIRLLQVFNGKSMNFHHFDTLFPKRSVCFLHFLDSGKCYQVRKYNLLPKACFFYKRLLQVSGCRPGGRILDMASSASFWNLSLKSLRARVTPPTTSDRGGAPGQALRIITRILFYLMVALCAHVPPAGSQTVATPPATLT